MEGNTVLISHCNLPLMVQGCFIPSVVKHTDCRIHLRIVFVRYFSCGTFWLCTNTAFLLAYWEILSRGETLSRKRSITLLLCLCAHLRFLRRWEHTLASHSWLIMGFISLSLYVDKTRRGTTQISNGLIGKNRTSVHPFSNKNVAIEYN